MEKWERKGVSGGNDKSGMGARGGGGSSSVDVLRELRQKEEIENWKGNEAKEQFHQC